MEKLPVPSNRFQPCLYGVELILLRVQGGGKLDIFYEVKYPSTTLSLNCFLPSLCFVMHGYNRGDHVKQKYFSCQVHAQMSTVARGLYTQTKAKPN